MIVRSLKKLTWWHVGLILILPIILALINPNWIFNLSITDDYIYLGHQMALPKYVGWEPSSAYYFIERLSVTLPGYVVRQFFSPLMANFVLHLGIYYLATFSVYGILNKLFNTRIAIIMALLFGQYPLIMRATGWDYVDGYVMLYMALGIYFLTQAPDSRWRSWYLMGAGGVYLLMITANLFNLFYAPALAIYLIFLESLYIKPLKLIKTGIYVFMGMGGMYVALALFYYQFAGRLLLQNSVEFIQTNQAGLQFSQSHFRNVFANWYLFLTLVAIMVIWRLMTLKIVPVAINPTSKRTPEQTMIAIVSLFLASIGVMVVWRLLGSLYMNFSFYQTNIVMTGFLLLGAIFSHKVVNIPQSQFKYFLAGAFFVPLMPFIAFTFTPQLLTKTATDSFFISAIGFAFASIVFYRTQTTHWLILFAMATSVPCGIVYTVNTYYPQRYFGQLQYEQTTAIFDIIDQRYDSFSLDDFRLWHDPKDPQRSVFLNVVATYLWSWGRQININNTTLANSFTSYDVILLSSPENTESFLEEVKSSLIRDKLDLVSMEEERAVTGFGETVVHFLVLRPNFFNPDELTYKITPIMSQSQFILEESGWNGYEFINETTPFRWTAEPLARLLLDFSQAVVDPQKSYRIVFSVVASLEEEVVNSLSLRINGEAVVLTRENNGYSGVVSGELLNSPTLELIFQTDRVSNPFDLGIQDGRKLGVAIGELTIAPMNDDE